MIGTTFLCLVLSVYDGDGPLRCANGVKVRVAGVQSPDFERAEPCRTRKPGYVCDDAKAEAARRITHRLTYRKTLRCTRQDRSWKRVVASCTLPDGRDLRCQLVASGAAVEWPRYVRAYNLRRCR